MRSLSKATLAIVFFLASLTACSQTDDEFLTEFRADFPKGCMETPAPPGVTAQQLMKLCECTADRMIKSFSVRDLKRFGEQQAATDAEKSQIATIGRSCAISLGITRQPQ